MILTRTPLRISLFGGGTDMPEFYRRNSGAVVSFAIDKYIRISVSEKFDGMTRVSYSKTENVEDPAWLEHELVRETLRHFDLRGLEIASQADIPGEGSGLGSSSAFTVGLYLALTKLIDGQVNAHPSVFAQAAYHIEREKCSKRVGKQDHYAAAYGGLHYFQFNPDETVSVELLRISNDLRYFLENQIMLFWTGRVRKADPILAEQAERLLDDETHQHSQFLAECAKTARRMLEDGDVSGIGTMMDDAWEHKKKLANVSTPEIDDLYARAKEAGAQGGKLCGAGGGGFMIFVAEPKHQRAIEEAIGLRCVRFEIEERGSCVVYKD